MPIVYVEPVRPEVSKSELIQFVSEVGGFDARKIRHRERRGFQAALKVPDGWEDRLVRALDGTRFQERRIRAWTESENGKSSATAEDHFQRLARLLKLEAEEEARQALERGRRLSPAEAEKMGDTLTDLAIEDETAGLGGRLLLTLAKRNRGSRLPWTRLDVGSPVALSAGGESFVFARGVVCERTPRTIQVALNDLPDDVRDTHSLRLDKSADEVATRRQFMALDRARNASGDRLADLRDILLGDEEFTFRPQVDLQPLDPNLNASQIDAVQFALAAQDVALIHGPPGTGKTTALVEVIRQAVRAGQKVLACAPSNVAVDNMLERLLAAGERAVRLGHPARVLPALREHTLDLLVEQHEDVHLAHQLVQEAFSLRRKADKFTRAKPKRNARLNMRQEAKELLADARRLENQAVESILNSADILCVTTTGLDSEILGRRQFDLAVIDEACQTTEPGCWIPLQRCQRIVLAGDHCQLPPTVLSRPAVDQGFGVSLFERLVALDGPQLSRRLTVQYRMHRDIMEFSSREFYEHQLVADASVSAHLLSGLEGVEQSAFTSTPIEFVDTAGAGFDEELEPEGESRMNRQEAQIVAAKVRALISAGLRPRDIAVIAPYAAQARLLRRELDTPGLEVDSVDGFQGREKEAIVISLVRSNAEGEIGFMSDVRRMNVALTRARRKLIVVGDSATLSRDPFYERLFAYFESLGAYRTVWEEPI